MEWEPITRNGKPDVKRLTQNGRAEVHVPISSTPPKEWANYFVSLYASFPVRSPGDEWPLPEISGAAIIIWPLKDELASWIGPIGERIEQSNKYYEGKVLPDQANQKAAWEEAERQYADEMERMRRQAEDL